MPLRWPKRVIAMNDQREPFESSDELKSLDAQLRKAMPLAPPPNLAQRVFDATVDQLGKPRHEAASPVIARIGPWPMLGRLAVAATVLLAVGIGVWLLSQAPASSTFSDVWVTQVVSVADDAEPIDTEIEMLAQDVQELAMAMQTASALPTERSVGEALWELETELETF